jgi:putative phosphonate metabolism protein
MESTPRYAIYYVPEQFSELNKFGSRWLGRDMISGRELPPEGFGKLTAELVRSITDKPRHYGLHATLKAPFVLKEDMTVDDLDLAVRKLASSRKGLVMPRLMLRRLGKFLALRPEHPSPELNSLADACVTELDRFRRRMPHLEMTKRVAAGLSAHQEDMLARWGYPYVLDEFHFHLTLTDPLEPELFAIVQEELQKEVDPLPLGDIHVDSICLCRQEDRQSPFALLERYPLLAD